jgi:hypothetical protein
MNSGHLTHSRLQSLADLSGNAIYHFERTGLTADALRGHPYAIREQPMRRTAPVFPNRWSRLVTAALRRLFPGRRPAEAFRLAPRSQPLRPADVQATQFTRTPSVP